MMAQLLSGVLFNYSLEMFVVKLIHLASCWLSRKVLPP